MDNVCGNIVAKPDTTHWNVITSAPTTSQVIGTLAAVVFAGIIFLLQQAPPSEDSDSYRYSSRALVTLLYVFFSLAAASFFFSVISGEGACRKAFGEGVVAGALFANAVVGTFLSVCWLFAAHRIGGQQVIWVKRMMCLAALTAWTFSTLTIFDAVKAMEAPTPSATRSGVLWWGLGLVALPSATLLITAISSSLKRRLQERASRVFELALWGSIASFFLAVGAFAVLASQEDVNGFHVAARFAIAGVTAVNFSLHLINMVLIERVGDPHVEKNSEMKPIISGR